jgi:cobalt-zinc-cadmium efflux system outer membrane protein
MSIRTIAVLMPVFWTLASPAVAQTTASSQPRAQAVIDPVNGLSLDQAIARGLAQEPALRAHRTAVDAARGLRQQAGLRRNPAVSVEMRTEVGGPDDQAMVTAEWPLDLFRRDGRIAVADREVAVVESAVAESERLLAADIRARYGAALVSLRELTVLDELFGTVRRQHDLLRVRAEQGASPPLERDLIEAEVRRLEADRLLQLGRVESALVELKRMLGMPPSDALLLRDTLEDVVARDMASTSRASERDRTDERSDVREAQARIGLADAKIDRARREGRFDVSVMGGYMRMDSGFPVFGLSPGGTLAPVRGLFNNVVFGGMVNVPLFNRNQGEVVAAHAERARATATLDAARLTAQADIAAARARAQRAQEAVQLYGAGARTLARQNLTVVEQSYELGRTTVFDVITEQKRYLDLERAYTETLRAAYDAQTSLKKALGEVR